MPTKKKKQPPRTLSTRLPVNLTSATGKTKTKSLKPAKPGSTDVTEARVKALAKVFATLGAKNAEKWARTHVDDGTDELGRFVLCRALWLRVVEPGRLLAQARKDKTAGPAVERMMKAASFADLDALIRFAQRQSLDDIARVLDDPGADNDDGIRWGVFRVDAKGMPLWTLDRLRAGLDDSEP